MDFRSDRDDSDFRIGDDYRFGNTRSFGTVVDIEFRPHHPGDEAYMGGTFIRVLLGPVDLGWISAD
ncbi:MAG: hypothetical protein EHM78_01950 [Myxococcaceae bacterium]|nr:MAG: hypothetical protein EHM78_01950 [Myxococcaceae bacterium]